MSAQQELETSLFPASPGKTSFLKRCCVCGNFFSGNDTGCLIHPGTLKNATFAASQQVWSCCGKDVASRGCVAVEHIEHEATSEILSAFCPLPNSLSSGSCVVEWKMHVVDGDSRNLGDIAALYSVTEKDILTSNKLPLHYASHWIPEPGTTLKIPILHKDALPLNPEKQSTAEAYNGTYTPSEAFPKASQRGTEKLELVSQFMRFTKCDMLAAEAYLHASNWTLETALDRYTTDSH